MRKLIILFLLICSLSLHAAIGKYTFNPISKSNTDSVSQPYELTVSELNQDNEILVKFQLNEANIVANASQPGKELVLIDGFGQTMNTEMPALPVQKLSLVVQQETPCEIEIISSDFTYLPCSLSSAMPSQIEGESDASIIRPIKRYAGYNSDTLLSYSDMEIYRGQYIHNILISPIAYNIDDSMLRICTSFTAKIKCSQSQLSKLSTNTAFDSYTLRKLSDNGSYVRTKSITLTDLELTHSPLCDEDLLIIATDDAAQGLKDYIDWKETLGYNVHVFTKSQWNSAEIAALCRSQYDSLINLTNVLLVGNSEDVESPDCEFNSVSRTINYKSDLRYACMDGDNDYTPEFFIARIPFSDKENVANITNKTITYEKFGFNDANIYTKHAVCSVYENEYGITPHQEVRGFVRTSEAIAAYGESLNHSFDRIFQCGANVYPEYWSSDSRYGFHEPIPEYLKKPSFSWSCTKNDIISAFNQGVSSFTFRYHGDVDRWCGYDFTSSDVNYFSNTYHPLVFSIACHTGAFNKPNCLASSILKGKYGASGIFASTEVSYSDINNILISGIYDAIWPTPGFKPVLGQYGTSSTAYSKLQHRICDIIPYAFDYTKKIYTSTDYYNYTISEYHFFGDPTMFFHSEKPKHAPIYACRHMDNKVGVDLMDSNEKCIISFKGLSSGKIERYYGDKATFNCPEDSEVQICLSGDGIIPNVTTVKVINIKSSNNTSTNGNILSCDYNEISRVINMTLENIPDNSEVEIAAYNINSLSSKATNKVIFNGNNHIDLDMSKYSNGVYVIKLYVNSKETDSVNILIN